MSIPSRIVTLLIGVAMIVGPLPMLERAEPTSVGFAYALSALAVAVFLAGILLVAASVRGSWRRHPSASRGSRITPGPPPWKT